MNQNNATRAAGSSAPACSPRFVVVSDLPEWTVWDQERQCDLFPTKSGNRDYACHRCGEDTAHLIADALNAYTANAALTGGEAVPSDAMFDKCVRRSRNGCTIRCRLGLWRVDAPTAEQAEREARHYWVQYHTDGEYAELLSNDMLAVSGGRKETT